MNKTQKGFAAFEGLLIFIIIAVIAGVGWYAIHTKHQTDKILSQADKISQSTPVNKSPSKTPVSGFASDGFLVINQLGIRIRLNDSISDAYYKDEKTSIPSVGVFLKSTNDLYAPNVTICRDNTLAVISKMDQEQYKNFLLQSHYEDNAVKIGSYDYYFTFPDGGPCEQDAKGNIVGGVKSKVQALQDAVMKLELIPQL